MLKLILSISGRPGLYKLVNQGRNMLIVEGLADGKRLPVHSRDKVISLGDVSIYTSDGGDTPLSGVFEKMAADNDKKPYDISGLSGDQLRDLFGKSLPEFDDERVKTSDIKKVYQWYNLLVNSGITEFEDKEETDEAAADAAEAPAAK